MDKDEALKLGLQLIATAEYLATDAEICGKDAKEERALIQRSKIAFEEALAQPEQEPVAWQVKYRDDEGIPQIAWFPHPVHSKSPLAKRPYTEEPLYTTPPQRKPEQESDDLTIAYMTGFHAGKNKDAPQPKPEQESVAWEVQAQLRPLYIDGADLSLDVVEQIHQWATQCVTDEREACAKTVEQAGIDGFGTLAAAAAIRARGNE